VADAASAFGVVLRRLRISAGLTQENLGFEAGLRRTYISVLELGNQQPTLTTLLKLSDALGCSASEMVAQVEAELAKARTTQRRVRKRT
jgi:transcriptional regulator with XRE-family HTH domain